MQRLKGNLWNSQMSNEIGERVPMSRISVNLVVFIIIRVAVYIQQSLVEYVGRIVDLARYFYD